ncbi:MAG: glycosyltransferase 87 family protein [Acidimicrobiales bacterium]
MAGAVIAPPRSPSRPRLPPWPYVAAVAAGAGIVIYLIIWGRRYGLDLEVYRGSVQAWHRGLDPYDGTFTASRLDFTYPPFALLVLSALAWGSFALTQWLLWVLSIAAATASVVIVLRDRGAANGSRLWCASFAWTCAAILVIEPARSGLDYGQIESVLMFLVVADLLAIPAPFRGVVIGIAAAVKLTPLVFLIVLVTRRDWASTLRALVSFCVWTLVTWVLWPAESRVFWRDDVVQTSRIGNVANPSNQSWNAVLHRPPFPANGVTAVWLLLSAVTLVVGAVIAWRCARTGRQAFAVIAIALAGLLVSPISWSHHWVWVLLVPPLLIGARGQAVSRSVRFLLWGLVALTVAGPYWWWSGTVRDALDALLPLWTFVLLSVWGTVELTAWRAAGGRMRAVTAPGLG